MLTEIEPAAYIAGGLSAEKVIFITNVNGLILNNELVKEMAMSDGKEIFTKNRSWNGEKSYGMYRVFRYGCQGSNYQFW